MMSKKNNKTAGDAKRTQKPSIEDIDLDGIDQVLTQGLDALDEVSENSDRVEGDDESKMLHGLLFSGAEQPLITDFAIDFSRATL